VSLPGGVRNIAMSMSACHSVRRSRISKTAGPNFTKFNSVVRQCFGGVATCDTLRTSGFADDVMFLRNVLYLWCVMRRPIPKQPNFFSLNDKIGNYVSWVAQLAKSATYDFLGYTG